MGSDRVIFWDFDATLGHRPENWSGSLVAALAQIAPEHEITRDQVRPFLRAGFPWHAPDVPHGELADPDRWWRNLEPVFVRAYEGVGVPSPLARQAAVRVRHRCADPVTYALFDDALPALRALAELGRRHRLITNHVPELPAILGALGLFPLVDHVTNSADVGYEKPHPEIFRLALEAAGHPREAWMVGDNTFADVLGAERVGMRGILVRRAAPRARRCCPDLGQVLGIVGVNRDETVRGGYG
jgi:putative hydrolase of the HAD superfamily